MKIISIYDAIGSIDSPIITDLVSSALLVQAPFVPVSYECSRGKLMKNLLKCRKSDYSYHTYGRNITSRLLGLEQLVGGSQPSLSIHGI